MNGTRISSLRGRITVVVVICCLIMVGLCVNTAVALDGSGTQGEPWLIQSLEDFNDFAADANYWDDYTRLETDVNLAGRTYSTAVIAPDVINSNYNFDGTAFTGVFDGNDHKVLNVTIYDGGASNDYLGLFGCIRQDGQIRNLGLEGVSVSGHLYVGGLVGSNGDWAPAGAISNCYSTGDVNGDMCVGGLVGYNEDGTVSNCYSSCYVSGKYVVGGLVGKNHGIHSNISNCYSTSDVNGVDQVGGLVGGSYYGSSVLNCYSTGDVSGSGWYVGGLVGVNDKASVSNCYSTGDVNGVGTVGGLVGVSGYDGSVSNCHSTGDVSGNTHVGGLVGENSEYSSVSNCYSTGDVSGDWNVGGLIGWNYGNVSNCFWDIDTQTHGITDSIGNNDGVVINVEGLTTAQMQTRSTFTDADWDFINLWNIGENQTYPYLRVYLAGDINKDRIVNFVDFCIIAELWMEEE